MGNLPIVLQEGGSNPPVLSGELQAAYAGYAEQMLTGFQGAFNRIKAGKMDFTLNESGVSRHVDNGQVIGVCLGMSPVDYCSWYEKTYEPGQEPEQPDLVWLWPDRNKFPAALPAQWHQKKNRNGQDRWDFRIARRSVWALVQPNPQTGQYSLNTDTPYIFDITSASLYGKSDTQMNLYKWAGLIQLCNRFSQPPNFICSPAMFLTRIRIDPTSTVSGVVFFEPLIDKNSGAFMYLDSATFASVVEVMQSQTIRDMLTVREILEWPKKQSASSPQQSQSAPQQQTASPGGQEAYAGQSAPAPSAQTSAPMQATSPQQVAAPMNPTQTVQPSEASFTAPMDNSGGQPTQQAQCAPTPPPVQTATATVNSEADNSRLAAAQAILNQGAAAAPSAPTGAAQAKPAEPAPQPQTAAAPTIVNSVTADAIKSFSDVL